MRRKAIIFDRDGTLIIDKVYLNDPTQIEYLPGVFDALRVLRDHGYVFAVATNQSGVARGIVQIENIEKIHAIIAADFGRHGIEFTGFYYAPYSVESNHPMRKPNPGMLEAAAKDHSIDLSQSWMIGDRMSDIEAGHRAGCRTVLLQGTERPEDSAYAAPTVIAATLLDAADRIIEVFGEARDSVS